MKFITQEQFMEMTRLQDFLNQNIHINWSTQHWNWRIAIKDEVMELLDFIGWKWWKSQPTRPLDDKQVHLELVDIWHFLLSAMMENEMAASPLDWDTALWYKLYPKVTTKNLHNQKFKEHLLHLDSDMGNFVKVKYFCKCMEQAGLDWEGLRELYIGKVALNNFRQDNGYKEGTYQKIWALRVSEEGRGFDTYEDNAYLEIVIASLHMALDPIPFTYQNVYDSLEAAYQRRDPDLSE